jgi:probable addiction module antidote protein
MRKIKTTRWDAAEHMQTEEDCRLFLEACFDEAGDDAAFIAKAFGTVARARGMMQLARETGLSREALYRALSEDGNPTLSTLLKVGKALGVRLTVAAAH